MLLLSLVTLFAEDDRLDFDRVAFDFLDVDCVAFDFLDVDRVDFDFLELDFVDVDVGFLEVDRVAFDFWDVDRVDIDFLELDCVDCDFLDFDRFGAGGKSLVSQGPTVSSNEDKSGCNGASNNEDTSD